MDKWVEKTGGESCNVVLVTGDNGFANTLQKLPNHHTTMVVYRRDKNVRRSSATLTASANIFCDFREFFDLPEECESRKEDKRMDKT
ncbi:unnamed protein product [Arabis nemorensis]|uniref:NYN domain-containing protein n=1 Tax=Arabis nemorensis TaxID=586526 RepID=A0A565CWD7_9BRAS|nr:unnamed protein product [Arabis nemorensis]